MAVTVKSEKQIALMREAGRLLAITHEELHKAVGVRVLYKQQLPALISRLYDRKWLVAA